MRGLCRREFVMLTGGQNSNGSSFFDGDGLSGVFHAVECYWSSFVVGKIWRSAIAMSHSVLMLDDLLLKALHASQRLTSTRRHDSDHRYPTQPGLGKLDHGLGPFGVGNHFPGCSLLSGAGQNDSALEHVRGI